MSLSLSAEGSHEVFEVYTNKFGVMYHYAAGTG